MPSALSVTHGLRRLLLGAAIAAVPLLLPGGVSAASPQAATADQAVPLTQPMSGHLDPNSAGSFAYYSFSYPGDQSTVTIDLNVTPDDPTLLPLTGFNVYGPRPGQVYATGGIENDLDPDVSGNVISSDPGTYVVQVYNYNPQNPIDFTVWIDGMAAQPVTGTPAPAAPTPAAASGTAGVLDGSNVVSGQLPAGASGSFAQYQFTYPGDGSVYTINVEITPDDPALLQNAGFRVYGPQPDQPYVTGGDQTGLVPNVSANLISDDAGTYTVQVYNYDPQRPISYQLSLVVAPPPLAD